LTIGFPRQSNVPGVTHKDPLGSGDKEFPAASTKPADPLGEASSPSDIQQPLQPERPLIVTESHA